jgi:hypothetical protein
MVALATIVFANALLHAGATLLTSSYSPGVISGSLLWLPLGASVLVRGFRVLPMRTAMYGLGLGVAVHAFVPLFALALSRML